METTPAPNPCDDCDTTIEVNLRKDPETGCPILVCDECYRERAINNE